MKRPRIVLADSNREYINTIQLRFIEEFFNAIDLEVITDRNYFNSFFTVPQRIDILVISDDFYNNTISRHEIGKTFLLTEDDENQEYDDTGIVKIYKYSHIKAIFNEIFNKAGKILLPDSQEESQKPQIITVTSASGGTGKTTVAMGLAASLSRNFKKVLYINCDRLQNFSYMLQNPAVITGNELYSSLNVARGAYYDELKHVIRTELFSYLPPFKASLLSLGISPGIFRKIAEVARDSGNFDFVVLDTDHVFNDSKAELLNISDKVIIVVKQTRSSAVATNALINEISGINNDKYIFVCNDFNVYADNSLVSQKTPAHFKIDEYIDHIENCENLIGSELVDQPGLNRIAFLIS